MAGVKPPLPRTVPSLRFATALATFLLVFSLATNALAPVVRQASQAPFYGMGGSGGGGPESESAPEVMSAATEAPAEETPLQALPPAPTLDPTLTAQDSARSLETPTPDAVLKNPAAAQPVEAPQAAPPIPVFWEIGLLLAALIFGGAAWLIRSNSERAWRAKRK